MELLYGIVLQLLLLYSCTELCHCVLVGSPPPEPGRMRGTAAPVLVGFYNRTCPRAEDVVRAQVQKRFSIDKSITPALLRMLFHDSFVRGADASILLDSKPGHEAEKEALPNLTIRGFDLIDETKDAVEAVCPGVVSCADILVMAVRDSVALAGGPRYEVPTGRLDGKVSVKEEALNLPSPAFPVEQSLESFRQKGLELEDMVALLGAHTVGVALCGFFNDRLFNFHGTGMADPTMNAQLVTRLSTVCPNPFFTESNADPPINLDQSTPALFDAAYYSQILAGNGILQIDQEITADPTSLGLVHSFTSATAFFPAFIRSIIKMGNIDVLTGNNSLGEIRRKCNVANSRGSTAMPVPAAGKPGPATSPTPGGPATKPAPPGQVKKPGPVGQVSKPPPVVAKPAPSGHGTKPPAMAKPTPTGHVSPPATLKPTPAAPVTKPPAGLKPPPVSKPPAAPKPTPVSKPPAAPKPSPAPPSRGSKSPAAPKQSPSGHISKPPAASKPTPPGHVTKPPLAPGGHVRAPAKPSPPGRVIKSPIPKPPFAQVSKPPFTPVKPSGHVSRPAASSPPPPL